MHKIAGFDTVKKIFKITIYLTNLVICLQKISNNSSDFKINMNRYLFVIDKKMVSVILATISNNDEASRFRNNLRFQQTFQTSTNNPQNLLDKRDLRFFRHR